MERAQTKLSTGIVITYDSKGNIKTLVSEKMDDLIFDMPTIDTEMKTQTFKYLEKWK